MIKYFISYSIFANGNAGFGNTVMEIEQKIKDMNDIREISSAISAKLKLQGLPSTTMISIINFCELEGTLINA